MNKRRLKRLRDQETPPREEPLSRFVFKRPMGNFGK
jgi:hypothetical protein